MKRFRLFDDILGNMNANRSPLEFLIVAAAAIAVIFIYTAALPGPFVFDDESNITENRHIRIKSLGFDELYAAAFKSPIPNRPVANLSLALNYYFNGYNVVGYRFANILIHILNGFCCTGLPGPLSGPRRWRVWLSGPRWRPLSLLWFGWFTRFTPSRWPTSFSA